MTATIKDVQTYWDARPCNIRHGVAPVGTKEYFDQVEHRRCVVEPHIAGFAQFGRWSGKRVLELGCGIGTDAVQFARAGAQYTGIDLSERSVELAERRFKLYGLTGHFIVGDLERLEEYLPFQRFDLVYSFGVIHHTPDPRAVVDAVWAYMKPSSEFRLMLYAANSWKAAMIEAGLDQPEAARGCPIARTYTEERARELLDRYDIVDLHQDHIFPYVVEKYVKHEYEVQPWFKAMPDAVFAALKRKLGWHMLITCKLKEGGE